MAETTYTVLRVEREHDDEEVRSVRAFVVTQAAPGRVLQLLSETDDRDEEVTG